LIEEQKIVKKVIQQRKVQDAQTAKVTAAKSAKGKGKGKGKGAQNPQIETPPKIESPKSQGPQTPTKTESPKVESPQLETPQTGTSKTWTPKPYTPLSEFGTPQTEVPYIETPKLESPKVETPKVETPKVETPKVETPKVETPKVETPKVDLQSNIKKEEGPKQDDLTILIPTKSLDGGLQLYFEHQGKVKKATLHLSENNYITILKKKFEEKFGISVSDQATLLVCDHGTSVFYELESFKDIQDRAIFKLDQVTTTSQNGIQGKHSVVSSDSFATDLELIKGVILSENFQKILRTPEEIAIEQEKVLVSLEVN